jgi:hypothetical protein
MTIFPIQYNEQVNNYWYREIEADTLIEAQDLFLKEIQGTEPDDMFIIDDDFF